MSVIRRLLSRATGVTAPALRPRLPGRFEATAGESQGLVERTSETIAQHLHTRASEPTRKKPETTSAQAVVEAPAPPPPSGTARSAQHPMATEDARPTSRQVHQEVGPRPHDKPAPPPTVARSAAAHPSLNKTEAPAVQPAPPHAASSEPGSHLPRLPQQRRPPPAPLLSHADPISPFTAAPTPLQPGLLDGHPGTPSTPVPAADSDIHIHIGRIELRAAPAKKPEPKRPPRERTIASLGAYLKGGQE